MTTLTKLRYPVLMLAAEALTESKLLEMGVSVDEWWLASRVERQLATMRADEFVAYLEFLCGDGELSEEAQDKMAEATQLLRVVEKRVLEKGLRP